MRGTGLMTTIHTVFRRRYVCYCIHEAPDEAQREGPAEAQGGEGQAEFEVPVLHEGRMPAPCLRRLQGPANAEGDDHPGRPCSGPPPHRKLCEISAGRPPRGLAGPLYGITSLRDAGRLAIA